MRNDDFTLSLRPIVPDGQEVFTSDVELSVRLETADGVTTERLGASADATWTLPPIPPLVATRVGLLLSVPGGGVDPVDLSDLRAWGLSPPITLSEGQVDLSVIVGTYGSLGRIGTLPEAIATGWPAIAALPDGDVLIFGGTDVVQPPPITALPPVRILRLDRGDNALSFDDVGDLPIPVSANLSQPRVGATATVLTLEGEPQVLVAGGREKWAPATKVNNSAFLWDPSTDQVSEDRGLVMIEDRSQHVAIPTPNGDLLFLGGLNSNGSTGGSSGHKDALTYEWFRLSTLRFEAASEGQIARGVGSLGFGWADLGESGVMICGGGAEATGQPRLLLASDLCKRLDLDGTFRDLPSIGEGTTFDGAANRMWHAMSTLPNGKVLLTGGVSDSIPEGATAPALATAWIFDPASSARTWKRLPDLHAARAMHAQIPLPDGRVMIVGGVDAAIGFVAATIGAPVDTVEIFDPLTETFSEVDAGGVLWGGAVPMHATAPGYGTFFLRGWRGAGMSDQYGIVTLGPG